MRQLDPALLAECEQARKSVQAAEDALSMARAGFERTVRRLYIEGGSTREIADVLGLSHQRVHQLIGAEPKSWWHRVFGVRQEPPRGCSFCGKAAKDVSKLVAGPGVDICDACVAGATTFLETEGGAGPDDFHVVPKSSLKRCSFCGQRDRSRALASRAGHQICSVCAEKARDIVSGSDA